MILRPRQIWKLLGLCPGPVWTLTATPNPQLSSTSICLDLICLPPPINHFFKDTLLKRGIFIFCFKSFFLKLVEILSFHQNLRHTNFWISNLTDNMVQYLQWVENWTRKTLFECLKNSFLLYLLLVTYFVSHKTTFITFHYNLYFTLW